MISQPPSCICTRIGTYLHSNLISGQGWCVYYTLIDFVNECVNPSIGWLTIFRVSCCSLVYRDIKPENIGFDVRGDVKIFDFGLCKNLAPELKSKGYGYRLTGRAGSLPYMAPEVALMTTYDSKCDVFSFSILLWEILSLAPAFKGLSPTQFMEDVVVKHERLAVPKTWPPLTRLMLPEAWDQDPKVRPDMKRVAILIRGDLNDMTDDVKILRRTIHMTQRSNHSFEFDASELNNSE
jgi:serine/threonine protein kinase